MNSENRIKGKGVTLGDISLAVSLRSTGQFSEHTHRVMTAPCSEHGIYSTAMRVLAITSKATGPHRLPVGSLGIVLIAFLPSDARGTLSGGCLEVSYTNNRMADICLHRLSVSGLNLR